MLENSVEIELSNNLSTLEYLELIKSVGWKSLTEEQVNRTLQNSMYVVKATINNEDVGMGRLVGDFGCHGMLTDIVINPKYQGKGIGTKIVLDIKEYANDFVKENERFIIELCPTTGNRDFYIKCGFKYKPENMDGMYLWIDKTK